MFQNIKIIDRFLQIQKFIEEKVIDQTIPLKKDHDQTVPLEDMTLIKEEELQCLKDIATALHHQGNRRQV